MLTPLHVNVFTRNGEGGNPCPIVLDAADMTPEAMRSVAKTSGHESGFVLPAESDDFDYRFRFWVPNHEMEMCGHATVAALWLLARERLAAPGEYRIQTLAGPVTGYVSWQNRVPEIEITQPAGRVQELEDAAQSEVLEVLGLDRDDILDLPVQNAVTSRVKTLVPVSDIEKLNAIVPRSDKIESLCSRIGSTGLYPYAVVDRDEWQFEARQFPRSSGYPEDAATGIAAAALAFGLFRNGLVDASDSPISVFQGRAMGCLSEIRIRLGFANGRPVGCLLGGEVTPA